jgi:hypothetical protein
MERRTLLRGLAGLPLVARFAIAGMAPPCVRPSGYGRPGGCGRASRDGPARRSGRSSPGGLAARMISFYSESLFNPYWGGQLEFGTAPRQITIFMAFQGLTLKQAEQTWAPFFDWVEARPADWQTAFWGDHYPRLLQVKERYDPRGLFFVHHGVGTGT